MTTRSDAKDAYAAAKEEVERLLGPNAAKATDARSEAKGAVDRLLGPSDLSERWNIPLQTIYKWQSSGTGPRSYRLGRHLRFREPDVLEWLEAQATTPRTAAS